MPGPNRYRASALPTRGVPRHTGYVTPTRSRKYLLLGMSGFMATRAMIWLIPLIVGHSRPLYADIGWDDSWYRLIATDGYDHGIGPIRTAVSHLNPTGLRHSNLAFFPAYPMAMRAVSALGFNEVWAGLIVTGVASLFACWAIFRIGELLQGPRLGAILAVLWGAQPASAVLSIGYSEALFTAIAAWSMLYALRSRLIPSALLAIVAGLCRPTGVAVVAAVWAAAFVHIAQRKQWRQALVASALAPLGWLGYVLFVAVRTGRWNGYLLVQREWHSGMDWGRTILNAIQHSLFDTQEPFPTMAIWLVLLAIILTMVLMVTRAPLPLLAYTLVSMFFVIVQTDFLKPRERFLLVIFPLLIPIARLLNRARASIVVGVLCTFAVLSTVVGNVLLNQRWSP